MSSPKQPQELEIPNHRNFSFQSKSPSQPDDHEFLEQFEEAICERDQRIEALELQLEGLSKKEKNFRSLLTSYEEKLLKLQVEIKPYNSEDSLPILKELEFHNQALQDLLLCCEKLDLQGLSALENNQELSGLEGLKKGFEEKLRKAKEEFFLKEKENLEKEKEEKNAYNKEIKEMKEKIRSLVEENKDLKQKQTELNNKIFELNISLRKEKDQKKDFIPNHTIDSELSKALTETFSKSLRENLSLISEKAFPKEEKIISGISEKLLGRLQRGLEENSDIKDLLNRIEAFRKKEESYEGKVTGLNKEINGLNEEIKGLILEIKVLQEKNEDYERELKELKNRIKGLIYYEEEVKSQKEKIIKSEREMIENIELKERKQSLEKEVDVLYKETKEKLHKSHENLQKTEQKLNISEEKLYKTEENLQISEENLNILKEKLRILEEKLRKKEEKLKIIEEKLNISNNKLTISEEKLLKFEENHLTSKSNCKKNEKDEKTISLEEEKRLEEKLMQIASLKSEKYLLQKDFERKLKELKEKLEEKQEENEKLAKEFLQKQVYHPELEAFKEQEEVFSNQIKDLVSRNEELSEALQQKDFLLKSIITEKSNVLKEKEEFLKENAGILEENRGLKGALQECMVKIEDFEGKMQVLKEKGGLYEGKHNEFIEKIRTLTEERDMLVGGLSNRTKALDLKEVNLQKALNENKLLKSAENKMNFESEEKLLEIKNLKETQNDIKTQLISKTKLINTMEQSINDLKAQITSQNKLLKAFDDLKVQLTSKTTIMKSYEIAQIDLKSQIASYQEAQNDLNNQILAYEDIQNNLKEQLASKNLLLKAFYGKLYSITNDLIPEIKSLKVFYTELSQKLFPNLLSFLEKELYRYFSSLQKHTEDKMLVFQKIYDKKEANYRKAYELQIQSLESELESLSKTYFSDQNHLQKDQKTYLTTQIKLSKTQNDPNARNCQKDHKEESFINEKPQKLVASSFFMNPMGPSSSNPLSLNQQTNHLSSNNKSEFLNYLSKKAALKPKTLDPETIYSSQTQENSNNRSFFMSLTPKTRQSNSFYNMVDSGDRRNIKISSERLSWEGTQKEMSELKKSLSLLHDEHQKLLDVVENNEKSMKNNKDNGFNEGFVARCFDKLFDQLAISLERESELRVMAQLLDEKISKSTFESQISHDLQSKLDDKDQVISSLEQELLQFKGVCKELQIQLDFKRAQMKFLQNETNNSNNLLKKSNLTEYNDGKKFVEVKRDFSVTHQHSKNQEEEIVPNVCINYQRGNINLSNLMKSPKTPPKTGFNNKGLKKGSEIMLKGREGGKGNAKWV